MLKSILSFVLILLLAGILTVALVSWYLYRTIRRRAMNAFRNATNAPNPEGSTQGKKTTTKSGETIVDARDPETANRKIFDKDEGEYVKFKEVE